MINLEFEKTYLAKEVPPDLSSCPNREIIDIYVPADIEHPFTRIRKNGSKFEITKKIPTKENDASEQEENTIQLNESEFNVLSSVKGKKTHKIRYDLIYHGRKAEVDVFKDGLEGLIIIDFEFNEASEKDSFSMPDFCLVDITQDKIFAGGMLCGKSYADIEDRLKELGYKKLFI